MTSFATVAELSAFVGKDIDANDPTAELALSLASDAVRAYCRQSIDANTETITVQGSGSTLLLLPETPVTAVTEVKVDGETVAATLYSFTRYGALYRTSGLWPGITKSVEVTYTHGHEDIPGAVKAATLSVAARVLDSPAGIRQEAIGAYSVTYTNGTPALLESETASLDPYRLV